MRADDDRTDIDVEYSDEEPTRRFIDPRLGSVGQVDDVVTMPESATSPALVRSDVHRTPVGGVPALVRMTADEDSREPLGTLIRCHEAMVNGHHTATVGVGVRFGRHTSPRGVESCTTLRVREDSQAQYLAARMRRVGGRLEMRLRDEAERSERTRVALLMAVGVVLGMLLVSMLWPDR
jgi:hypothetical protein